MPSQSDIAAVYEYVINPLSKHYGRQFPDSMAEMICDGLAGASTKLLIRLRDKATFFKKLPPDETWLVNEMKKIAEVSAPNDVGGNIGNGMRDLYARDEKAREHHREYAQRWMLNNPIAQQARNEGREEHLQRYVEAFVWPISQRMHDIRNVGYDHATIFGMGRKYDQAEEQRYWQHVSDCLNSNHITVIIPSWLEEEGRVYAQMSQRHCRSTFSAKMNHGLQQARGV
jgi:hypothetical protein